MRMSPAVTTRIGPSGSIKPSDLAMRAGITPAAWAASSTVALEVGNSSIFASRPKGFRYSLTLDMDMGDTSGSWIHVYRRLNKQILRLRLRLRSE